jgi:hypothetical protein
MLPDDIVVLALPTLAMLVETAPEEEEASNSLVPLLAIRCSAVDAFMESN